MEQIHDQNTLSHLLSYLQKEYDEMKVELNFILILSAYSFALGIVTSMLVKEPADLWELLIFYRLNNHKSTFFRDEVYCYLRVVLVIEIILSRVLL